MSYFRSDFFRRSVATTLTASEEYEALRASFFLFLLVAHGCIVAAEHPTWQQLDARAKELYQQGKLKDAEAAMREAIPLAEKENGPVYDRRWRELNNLARILKAQNYARGRTGLASCCRYGGQVPRRGMIRTG